MNKPKRYDKKNEAFGCRWFGIQGLFPSVMLFAFLISHQWSSINPHSDRMQLTIEYNFGFWLTVQMIRTRTASLYTKTRETLYSVSPPFTNNLIRVSFYYWTNQIGDVSFCPTTVLYASDTCSTEPSYYLKARHKLNHEGTLNIWDSFKETKLEMEAFQASQKKRTVFKLSNDTSFNLSQKKYSL